MQKYYFNPKLEDSIEYLKNFIAYIDIDNDGTYMNMVYDENKISEEVINDIINSSSSSY